ncbi:unnamed protein product [Rhizophagus irregularis]|nr:unnamed protein product [Rhizophagus irregularis]
MIDNSTFLQFEEVLIIESFFDLKDTVKGLDNDDENSDESDIDSDNNSDVDSNNNSDVDSEDLNDSANDESDYDVEELAQQHLLDDDLVGNTL